MLVTNGLLTHAFDEVVRVDVPRLGRHLALDARSLAYTIERDLELLGGPLPIRPVEHLSPIPVLDQQRLGSCTGNAGTYAVAAQAGPNHLGRVGLGVYRLDQDPDDDEDFAVELYHRASLDDGFPGGYPPTDTGSSGLGVCRALKAGGLIDRYTWATSLHGFASLLQRGGVMLGTPWYESWFEPGVAGFVDSDPGWQRSGVAGGHEIYIEALESWNDRDPHASVIRFRNSWGPGWGDQGSGRMRMSTYVVLHRSMDVKQLGALKV